MQFKKKVIGLMAVVTLLFSLLPTTVFAAANKTFTINKVVYDGTADTTTEKFSTITSVTYTDEGVQTTLPVSSDKLATLTVDGVQYDIVEGKSFQYKKDTVINLTAKDESIHQNVSGPGVFLVGGLDMTASIDYYFRAAAFIKDGSLLKDYSVSKAIKSGKVTDTKATDVTINSKGSFFNGFYIKGSDYSITNLDMTLLGDGGDDFNGWGAGITVTGLESNVEIDNAKINTKGIIRTAIWAGGEKSTINVKNSVIQAFAGDSTDLIVPMLVRVPWALGLEGNIRATNVLGSATANYSDSIVVSESWGALSTDSGVSGTDALFVENVLGGIGYLEVAQAPKKYDAVKTVKGVKYGLTIANSGYVTYADAGVVNHYDNVQFYAPDYIQILASKTSSAYYTGLQTVCVSKRFGAMWHQNQGGALSLIDGSWTTSDIMFLCKSTKGNTATPILTVDRTKLSIAGKDSYSGVLYQLLESDDAGGPFASGYTIPTTENDWSTIAPVEEVTTTAKATFTDINTTGNIYNSVYTVNQALDVTLKNSKLVGIISSSNANHVDEGGKLIPGGTFISANDPTTYTFAGRVVNKASKAVNNGVNLTLKSGTNWVCSGTSYINTLTIDKTSSITAPKGYKVVMTVGGKQTAVKAGISTDVVVSIVK
ncbi:MAG: hypothetical protein K0S04_1921 [Herbinix sp.]|jgi:hypothetical protein|nr:hypothetical protein [Herbinix sp.]